MAEGSGATPAAAIVHSLSNYKNRKMVALLSSGNVDVNLLARTIDKGLVKNGRKCFLTSVISDRPGALAQLLQLIASRGANVLAVSHRRETLDIPISYAKVELSWRPPMRPTYKQSKRCSRRITTELTFSKC
ncbi:hypothetical protein JCM17380_29200 [Desulfosporosinus burensis]